MDPSILIARLAGPVILVAGLAMFVNRKQVSGILEDFMSSPALIFVAGVLAMVLGLAIVTFHNLWVADWRIILTLFGWIAIAAGIVRMVFPGMAMDMGKWIVRRKAALTVAGAADMLLGAFLTYMGFAA